MRRFPNWLALAAATGPVVYMVLIVALHVLRPDYDPARRFLSEYSVGPFGFLGTASFGILAISLLLVSLGLRLTVRPSLALTCSGLLFVVTAAAFLTSAVFPTDLQPAGGGRPTPTRSGTIHDLAALVVFASLVPAFLILPFGFKRDPNWRSLLVPSLLYAFLFLAGIVLFVLLPWSLKGWAERAVAAMLSLFLFLTALRVRSRADPDSG
jgi:hypothetical membrane protein